MMTDLITSQRFTFRIGNELKIPVPTSFSTEVTDSDSDAFIVNVPVFVPSAYRPMFMYPKAEPKLSLREVKNAELDTQ
jgi:hypothetical protein